VTAGLALGAHFADLAPDLRRDPRMATLRALAGISLMPTGQPTTFEDKLDKLKICASLVESELAANPVCPHCCFRPANEQGELLPAANVLKTLDDELDRLLDGWRQTLLDNLDDPIIQANFELLKAAQRDLIKGFLASKSLPDPVTPDSSRPCRSRQPVGVPTSRTVTIAQAPARCALPTVANWPSRAACIQFLAALRHRAPTSGQNGIDRRNDTQLRLSSDSYRATCWDDGMFDAIALRSAPRGERREL
jgi:hypothetical protein